MPNLNYRRGADYERWIVNHFRNKGWLAFRSAGSHSPIDVIAVDPLSGEIKLIQAKTGAKIHGINLEKIIDLKKLNGYYNVAFELWEKDVKSEL